MTMRIGSALAISAVTSLWLILGSGAASAGEPLNEEAALTQMEVIELCSLARVLKKDLNIADRIDAKLIKDKILSFKDIPDVVRCPYGKRHFRLKGYTSFGMEPDGKAFMLETSNKLFDRAVYFLKHNDEWQFVTSEQTWEF